MVEKKIKFFHISFSHTLSLYLSPSLYLPHTLSLSLSHTLSKFHSPLGTISAWMGWQMWIWISKGDVPNKITVGYCHDCQIIHALPIQPPSPSPSLELAHLVTIIPTVVHLTKYFKWLKWFLKIILLTIVINYWRFH